MINEIKKIWQYENNFNIQTKSYILVIKIVKLTQKEVSHPVTKLSQVIDPEIGIGISPSNICEDLLNILTLSSSCWFKIIKQLSRVDENDEFSLIKQEFKKINPNKQGKDLAHNLETLCSLREDQFYLIQKSLSRLNQSLKSVDEDIELGLVLLVSSIEIEIYLRLIKVSHLPMSLFLIFLIIIICDNCYKSSSKDLNSNKILRFIP